MPAAPRVIVIAGYGLNCDAEAAFALRAAGFIVDIVPLKRVCDRPGLLTAYQALIVPGGFSYGDELGAGNAMACMMRNFLLAELSKFLDNGKIVMGICNGCQILLSLGIIGNTQQTTLYTNKSGHYECRWINVRAPKKSIWFDEGEIISMPVAHQEGRFVFADPLLAASDMMLQYCDNNGDLAGGDYPLNPNGSDLDAAAISNKQGNALGIMPHPERGILSVQPPDWTRFIPKKNAANDVYNEDKLRIFKRMKLALV